jgi:hypothetical protein
LKAQRKETPLKERTDMMTSTNTSRPTYRQLEADPHGTQHWFVTSGATPGERSETEASLRASVNGLEVWSVGPEEADHRFDDEAGLLSMLERALADAKIGLRIYALGTEPFIWSVRQIAERYSLAREAVKVSHSGSLQRRVYCIHCRTQNEGVRTNVVACGGCGRQLLVRDHFSRRLAAFMGVQVDAEVAGELPLVESVYE